jgi:hypothetical protein
MLISMAKRNENPGDTSFDFGKHLIGDSVPAESVVEPELILLSQSVNAAEGPGARVKCTSGVVFRAGVVLRRQNQDLLRADELRVFFKEKPRGTLETTVWIR